jgi:Tetratricopeptide repeat
MKLWFFGIVVLGFLPLNASAQVGLPSSSQPSSLGNDPLSRADARPSESGAQIISLVGKVAVEDGATVQDRTAVVLECSGSEHLRTTTDRSGDFDMTVTVGDAGSGQPGQQPISVQNWNECELYADTSGYQSERLRLFGSQGVGIVQVGTIWLHPLTKSSGAPAISVISLAAPDTAKKAFEKGQEQEKKGKWAAARDYFKKAVEVYPRYSLAWVELGRTQLQQNNFAEAQQSFHTATQEDPHYIDAYVQIAKVALQKNDWRELADASEHIVELSPDSGPNYWFLNSAANLNLGDVSKAEKSATRAMHLDSNHKLPQLEYLYGMIRARQKEYKDAVFHVQTYLQLAPHAADAANAQSKLAELQKLAASQGSQTTASK